MSKIDGLKGQTKHAAIAEDWHNPTMPANDAELWACGLTTTLVVDLSRPFPRPSRALDSTTNGGQRRQQYFYAVSDHGGGFNDGGQTSAKGRLLIAWIANAVISAAEG